MAHWLVIKAVMTETTIIILLNKGINSAISLSSYRTHKKDGNKEGWLELKQSQEYTDGLKKRYKVERKFGEARAYLVRS